MRAYHCLLFAATFFLCFTSVSATPPSLQARQDEEPSSRSEAPAGTTSASPSSRASAETSRGSPVSRTPSPRVSQTTDDLDATPTHSATPTDLLRAPATTAPEEALPSSTSTSPDDADSLPIHPKITPAIGLTGALLMLSGLVYTVIGIKNKWLYVFSSAAYLTSLAVTVLIVYLMNPPVSDAVQGAFFVAAFFTGVIFGGLALVFADVTEGLGCLLGGFCLSMWFLTLKADGLIPSATGRAIFIGCMSAAGFFLSFSHYTRTYGLIVSISFAGATIAMLGIDCFSRAGWKEFWLWLWDLNPNTFPLNSNNYPLTKGIRVELAGVILVTLFGIVSQLRVWKLVKEHREKTAIQRLEQERDMNRQDAEIGQKVQDDFSKERAQWEAIYGDKPRQQDSVMDSSVRSSLKTSLSIGERDLPVSESVEMASLPQKQTNKLQRGISTSGGKGTSDGTVVTIAVLEEEEEIQRIDSQGKPLPQKPQSPASPNVRSAKASSEIASTSGNGVLRTSPRSSVPPPPVVVPLPFVVRQEDDANSEDADTSSVSAKAESVDDSVPEPRRFSKRISGSAALKRLSGTRSATDNDDEAEALIIPHVEDDRASSVAATLDNNYESLSLPDVSPPGSPTVAHFDADSSDGAAGRAERDAARAEVGTTSEQVGGATEEVVEERATSPEPAPHSLTVSTDPKSGSAVPDSASPSSPRPRVDTLVSSSKESDEGQRSKFAKSVTPSQSSQAGSRVSLSKEVLPERLSKVALSYRTNEWAKHLELAERPELEHLAETELPVDQAGERPAPVSDEIVGVVPTTTRRTSKRVSSDSHTHPNRPIRADSDTLRLLSRTPSMVIGGEMSRSTPVAQNRVLRSSSSPYLAPSPEPATGKLPVAPMPVTGPTLMEKRESLVRSRFSSQSFQKVSSPSLPAGLDSEDMTLAQRRQIVQQQKSPMPQQKQRQKPPSASQKWHQSRAATSAQVQAFDSHQPRRSSGGINQDRREDMLANWRESLKQNATPVREIGGVSDSQRAALLDEKRQKESREQQGAIAAQQRESMMNNMMRSGEMMDAHREAMRRMQATANRHVS